MQEVKSNKCTRELPQGCQLIFQQKLKWWKGKTYNQEYSTQQDSHSDLIEKSQKLSRQAREFSTIKPVLQQMLKELL